MPAALVSSSHIPGRGRSLWRRRPFAKVRPVTDPVVMTDLGLVRGVASEGVYSFRGIPFASAPEGPLRFLLPVPPARWDGVRDAAAFGCAPPQPVPAPGVPPFWRPGDGLDCLTLNVWSPDPGSARLPVMVWIYGGLWKFGSSSMPQYDAGRLARSGVVVVTVNYRVGFEGLGHLPGVPENRACTTRWRRCSGCSATSPRLAATPPQSPCSASPQGRVVRAAHRRTGH